MKIIDRGNAFDKANNRDYRDANPNKLKRITDDCYHYYFQFGILCEDCPVNSGLGDPKCGNLEKCNLKNHDCSGKGKGKIKPVIETKVQRKSKYEIFLSRSNLLWLYYNKIPYIFRTGHHNHVIQHHIDENPLNDKPDNIIMITTKSHNLLHQRKRKLENLIKKNEYLVKTYPEIQVFSDSFSQMIKIKNELLKVKTEDDVWEIIKNDCKELGIEFRN